MLILMNTKSYNDKDIDIDKCSRGRVVDGGHTLLLWSWRRETLSTCLLFQRSGFETKLNPCFILF